MWFTAPGQIATGVDIGNVAVVNLDMGPDLTVKEGDTVVLTPTITDPLGRDNPFSYLWRVQASNGQVVTEGHDATFNFKPFDNGVYKARLFVTDAGRGLTAEPGQVSVTALNVAPVIEAGVDRKVNEGDLLSVNMLFSDLGTNDTHSAVIDWGDQTTSTFESLTELLGSGTLSSSHVYADDGKYAVTVRVRDDDGGVGEDTLAVDVANAAPTVNAGPDRTAFEGQPVSLSHFIGGISVNDVIFSDPGTLDTFTVVSEACSGNGTLSGAAFNSTTGAGSFDCTFKDGLNPAVASAVSVQVRT